MPRLYRDYVHTDNYVQNGVYNAQVIRDAQTDAANRGKLLVIGWARTTGGDRTHWEFNSTADKLFLVANYHAIQSEPDVELRFGFDLPGDAYVTLDHGSTGGQAYGGYARNLTIRGPGKRDDKSVVFRLSRTTNFQLSELEVNGADVGLDFRNNCFLSTVRGMRTNFNTLNCALNIAGTRAGSVAQSGSDLSFYDLLISGMRCAVNIDGNQGGFHFYNGQFSNNGDQSAIRGRGVIETGYDYLNPDFVYSDGVPANIYNTPPTLNGYAPTGVSHLTFYDPSFEGAWFGDVMYAHEGVFGGMHSPNVNASKTGTAAMRGMFNFKNVKTSRFAITGNPRLGGTFRERALWKVGGVPDGAKLSEEQWSTKLGDLSIAGQSFPNDTLNSPMIYGGFKKGYARMTKGGDYWELLHGNLYRVLSTGEKVYYPEYPNLNETTSTTATSGLSFLPTSGQKPLTPAEYDALSTAEKNNGLLYFVDKA